MAAIDVDDLRKTFDTPQGSIVAVNDIDLEVEEGEFVTLVGPSGCGKTTTLRCIAGLETPTSGSIKFGETEITETPPNKRNLAMMFQNIALYPHMTVIDNIAYPLKVRGVPKEERYEEARRAAEILQIPELLEKYPGELSGGQQQRAALSRTIVQDPVVFLMDEPLSDLDAKLKVEVRKEIQRIHRRIGRPTIYVTHDQEEAMTMSDRIAVMNEGDIEQIGTRDEVYNEPTNMFVAEFIGNPSINFLEATLEERDGDRLISDVHGTEMVFRLDTQPKERLGDTVIVGFRPQSVEITAADEPHHFEGQLLLVEPIDDRALATLEGPDGELRATVPTDTPMQEGATVAYRIETDSLCLFDPESRELVAKATVE